MGAGRCTERRWTAPNGTERRSTAPTATCRYLFAQVRVGTASCFTRSAPRFRRALDSFLCDLVEEYAQVTAVRSCWIAWPCKWEQVGCRLAKWSPLPKSSPTLDRVKGADLRRCGRAARRDLPEKAEVVRVRCSPSGWCRLSSWAPLTPFTGAVSHRCRALGAVVVAPAWIPGAETRIPPATL